jgi:hypothetical protein
MKVTSRGDCAADVLTGNSKLIYALIRHQNTFTKLHALKFEDLQKVVAAKEPAEPIAPGMHYYYLQKGCRHLNMLTRF